jgi:hypothetical protein
VKRRTLVVLLVAVVIVLVVAGTLSYLLLVRTPSTPGAPPPSGVAVCSSNGTDSSGGNWTTYHGSNTHGGVEAAGDVTGLSPLWGSPTSVDGQVYAEPLTCGNAVFVATEGDSVYALNASSGATLWAQNLGTPMPGASLPCGDISPSGITGTPVIDVATGTLYAVAFLSSGQHLLFGLSVANGSVLSQRVVDANGSNPLVEQQRGALVLANGYVYIEYGGLYGDCGDYHGWVVGAPVSGSGPLVSYQVPTQREGGIWGVAGAGVAANGDLYVATGNGASSTTFDHGDAVIELAPNLTELGYFAPTNWVQLNEDDLDLGSVAPTVLPDGDVFEIGKQGVGYLLSGSDLGGIGGEITNASICAGGYGGTALVGTTILVPCDDGITAVVANATNLTVAWQSPSFDAGSPVVTGNVIWVTNVSRGDLLGLDLASGQIVAAYHLGSVDHFVSPAAAPGRLFVGAGSEVYGFSLA